MDDDVGEEGEGEQVAQRAADVALALEEEHGDEQRTVRPSSQAAGRAVHTAAGRRGTLARRRAAPRRATAARSRPELGVLPRRRAIPRGPMVLVQPELLWPRR